MGDNTRSTKKKLLAAGVAVAVGAGMVGVGANWDRVDRIAGNTFTAEIPDPDAGMDGAVLRIDGDPIEHDFVTTTFGDFTQEEWTLTNIGPDAAPFQGTFKHVGAISTDLAENLTVEYGAVDENGDVVPGVFVDGGTMAAPKELTEALGIPSEFPGYGQMTILVRVTLDDPTLLEGDEGDVHSIVASFDVEYMNPSAS